ncbi:hypothetical protein [Sphingomonas prati]|uniref:Secreted protein n=1 Tax=Sphingomonas prati TaxID=1843237 RepID=A0A7W9BQ15_9SPHN|nr:hypothetical protein [Sphingomonas prati]MBB5727992.1 hypothetical protein [Sphingomonas prati]GGE82440.1 hypothetical protein GCM10011404_13880 [Sphingomonas prati]
MFAVVTGLMLMLQPVTAAPASPPAPAATPAFSAGAAATRDLTRIVAASGLPALAGDAFRFTDIAPGGTVATIFDARRTGTESQRTIVTLSFRDGAWTPDTREAKRLAPETFDYMSGRIATAITTGGPATPCPDGSDYLSERATAGTVRALPGCGTDHPNLALARLFGVRETP